MKMLNKDLTFKALKGKKGVNMNKIIAFTLCIIMMLAVVPVHADTENGISVTDGVTIAGGMVEISVYADFKTPVRSISIEIRYPGAFEYAGVFEGWMLYNYDPVELTIYTEPGLIVADIDVECLGITGVGQLLKLNFRVPEYYPAGTSAVVAEVDGMDIAVGNIIVHKPTASDAINLMRWIYYGAPAPDAWMDMNADGKYTACDALLILRRVLEIG